MDAWENVVLGIATGILTSALIALALSIFYKVIIPWYLKIKYQGLDISGEWKSSYKTDELEEDAVMAIEQEASSLKATMSISSKRNGEAAKIKTYSLSGSLENRLVGLSGSNINKQQIGKNVMLLQVADGGNKLLGYETWFSAMHNKIESIQIQWLR